MGRLERSSWRLREGCEEGTSEESDEVSTESCCDGN
jgi:hypothetical protein